MTAEPGTVLCRLTDIADGGAREVPMAGAFYDIFLVRVSDRVYGYRNSCPHTGVALNWRPDDFVDPLSGMIQCSVHGAQFRIADGYCVWGPCRGKSLMPVALSMQAGVICLADAAAGSAG